MFRTPLRMKTYLVEKRFVTFEQHVKSSTLIGQRGELRPKPPFKEDSCPAVGRIMPTNELLMWMT